MSDSTEAPRAEPNSLIGTAVNILVSPSEALADIRRRPNKLFPLTLILLSTAVILAWYFNTVDFDWYVDEVLAVSNLQGDELETSREAMLAMSPNLFMLFGVIGGTLGTIAYYVLQSGYLALLSALGGDDKKFGHWFSLVCWTALPQLLAVAGMLVTILLSPNGQLSPFDLNPLTLHSLGMETGNESLNNLFTTLNLTMLWSVGLLIMGYRQWQGTSLGKAIAVIASPYLLALAVWAFVVFA